MESGGEVWGGVRSPEFCEINEVKDLAITYKNMLLIVATESSFRSPDLS